MNNYIHVNKYYKLPQSSHPVTSSPCHLVTFCLLLLFAAGTAKADWSAVPFDLTKNDANAYTTDIPASAFTADGLKLPLKAGTTYTLTSKQLFTGDFSFDLQQDTSEVPNGKIAYSIEMVLINNDKQRKAVGTYTRGGYELARFYYLKDGKAAGFKWGDNWCDSSISAGHDVPGPMEWFRLHKAGRKLWFMQKFKGIPYRWGAMSTYPPTDYFQEDCDAYQVGFVVRCTDDAAGSLKIKSLTITGTNIIPRDTKKREYLFDFGPVNQELEDGFIPVSEYTMYTPEKGMGWVLPEPEKTVIASRVPGLDDAQIKALGYQPISPKMYDWNQDLSRQAYWMRENDAKMFYSGSHGFCFIEFFQEWLDLLTPLERDFVGMGRCYHFGADPLYSKDVEERRGSMYIDDDLSAEFVVDLPNGQYNMILGVGLTSSLMTGESSAFNMEINGRVRKQGLGPNWQRCCQFPVRGINVENGQMRVRFFADVRKAMDKYFNHTIGTGWMVNYMLILPAEQRELMDQWEWKIIKERGEIIRRVAFVKGDPAVTHSEGRLPVPAAQGKPADPGQTGFLTLNGKPLYFLKLLNNYIPGTTEHFGYYCLTNFLHASSGMSQSKQFFKPDWEKLSYSDDYPWGLVDRLNCGYAWGYLTGIAHNEILSFVPQSVMGEGNPTVDSRGRRNRWNIQPPLNSALGKEIQKEAFTMMSNQLSMHPGIGGHFIYEELWHPEDSGYDDQSLLQYWGWLQNKYKTIEALNKNWGTDFKDWDDIVQPTQGKREFWEYTPEYVNFRKFRGWAQREMIKSACDLVRAKEPDHFTWGAKGDFGTQSWYPAEFMDGFGWYSPEAAASVARYFGKTALTCGYHLECEFSYVDGRKQFDHKPGPKQFLGKAELDMYNRLISSAFKGAKGFWNEWYSDGQQHAFHRTTMIAKLAPEYGVRHWTGQLAFFDPAAFEGPPVKMERAALYAQRANQMLYRLSELWLPAAPLEPKVLIPMTEESFFLGFFDKPYADYEEVGLRILRASNLAADFIEMPATQDLSKYQLIIIGDTTQAITKADAQRIRQFVNNGGKLILMNAGGFADDDHPRRYYKDDGKIYPLEEFADLGGYTLEASNQWHMPYYETNVSWVKNDIDPSISDGTPLGTYTINHYYVPREGSQVFLKGHLGQANKDVVLGLINAKRNVAVVNFPPKGSPDSMVHPLSIFFRKILTTWKIDGRITLDGVDDAWDFYAGTLTGDGHTLVTVCNNSENPRKLSLKLNTLPPGNYAISDVTGERPDLIARPDGGPTLKPNAAARETKIDLQLSADQIAKQGIPCNVAAGQSQVFLIRRADDKVWVSIWKPWLKAFAQRPLTIVYGTAPADKSGATDIQATFAKLGITATVIPADQVKRHTLTHDVRINPNETNMQPREDKSKWYLVDSFVNDVVDSDNNIIAVGSIESNALQKLWVQPNAFVYDKVSEKITSQYPGPGRGVIGSVDSVNFATYDVRSQSRDAIIVGGSDDAGTRAAVQQFITLIAQHCIRPVPPSTPPATPSTK
ncbi:MAG: beta-galactosidase [Phycisphaerales bacterium]|nr:beta-galactosidase [Phycisphaerales bacterium]